MVDTDCENVFNQAMEFASSRQYEFLTLEIILLALIEDESIKKIIKRLNLPSESLKIDLLNFLNDKKQFSILGLDRIKEIIIEQYGEEELKIMEKKGQFNYRPELSLSAQRVVQYSIEKVRDSHFDRITPTILLMCLYEEKDSVAYYLLDRNGFTRKVLYEPWMMAKQATEEGYKRRQKSKEDAAAGAASSSNSENVDDILKSVTTNLNELARLGKLPKLIGRENELQRIYQTLGRKSKNHCIIVGPSGVGKTAIIYGLTCKVIENKVPEILKDLTFYSLDLASLLAGTKFRGDFEERMKKILKALQNLKENNQRPVLFIDEMHMIMGAGNTGAGMLDVSNLLRPALSTGDFQCIGCTTYEDYRKFVEKDSAFIRRFQKIEILPPSDEETKKILQHAKVELESHHHVMYSTKVLDSIIELAHRYMPARNMPDVALDIMDEVGSYVRLKKANYDTKIKIQVVDVEDIITQMARVPRRSVKQDETLKLKDLEQHLKAKIFGQDQAIEQVVEQIQLSRAGLRESDRPMGQFLFSGPTGVGKTELAKQLALELGIDFIRFDMSEFMEKHSVSKLIGAPPGYVGHDAGGELTEKVNKNPHCVLLLDEIEKAHPDIFNILLQIMDGGHLTDSQGRKTDFRNVIVIMTSNAGARENEDGAIGIQGGNLSISPNHRKVEKKLQSTFSPEFRNRLDRIIIFKNLSFELVLNIVRKFLKELENQLVLKGCKINYNDDVIKFLATEGFDSKLGARPISRIINEQIKAPLSKIILFEEISDEKVFELSIFENKIRINF